MLSDQPHKYAQVSFLMARNIGRIDDDFSINNNTESSDDEYDCDIAHSGIHVNVQCFPVVSYMAALGVQTVDYFSLDIEGSEIQVLETIPFDKVNIKVIILFIFTTHCYFFFNLIYL